MNVKNKLKSRAAAVVARYQDDSEENRNEDNDIIDKTHNFKTELFNIFTIGVCFCLLFGGFNTMSQLTVGRPVLHKLSKLKNNIPPDSLIHFSWFQGLIFKSYSLENGLTLELNNFVM